MATADLGTYINALEASVASYCLDKPVGPTVLLLKVALGAQGPPFELGWDGSEPPEHWGLAMLRRCDDVERPSVSGEVRLLLTFDLTGSGTVQ